MEFMESFPVLPAIALLAYLVAEGVKILVGEKVKPYLPILCGLLGGALGALCHFCLTLENLPPDLLSAICSGALSGLAATGCHQVAKQLEGQRNDE